MNIIKNKNVFTTILQNLKYGRPNGRFASSISGRHTARDGIYSLAAYSTWQQPRLSSGKASLHGLTQATLFSTSSSVVNSNTCSVSEAKPNPATEWLELTWADGQKEGFPYLWLRDNCRCSACYNASSMSRRLLMRDLDPDSTPADVKVSMETSELHITWSDGHTSSFSFDWLKEHSFTEANRIKRREWMKSTQHKLWNRDSMQDQLPTFKFEELLKDDLTLHNWIQTLEQIGTALITETPTENGQLLKLGERVAFLRKTNYGELFQVKAKLEPSNQGYTPDTLGMHTDLAYYWHPPGVACLHCISQVPTGGGESELADGFYVAELMRREYPDHFETLSTVPVDFYDEGTDFYQFYNLTRHCTFGLDSKSNLESVVYNNPVRDSHLMVPIDRVQPLYKALCTFERLLYHPDNHIRFKLKPGDIICYQNVRVLHGRTGYKVLEKGEREVEGGNLDWDELLSRRRVIATKLGPEQSTDI